MKAKDIKGFMVNKKEFIKSPASSYEKQGEVDLSLRDLTEVEEDKLVKVMEDSIKDYKRQCQEGWPNPLISESRWAIRAVYKAIIAALMARNLRIIGLCEMD